MHQSKEQFLRFALQRRKFFDAHKEELLNLQGMLREYANGKKGDEFFFLKIQQLQEGIARAAFGEQTDVSVALDLIDEVHKLVLLEELK